MTLISVFTAFTIWTTAPRPKEPPKEIFEPIPIDEQLPNKELPKREIPYFIFEVGEPIEQAPEIRKMRVTCYTATGNPTASGVMPYEGGCAAKREWIGGVAILYDTNMNFVARMDINDCGGASRLKNGTSIDVYRDTLSRCYEWVAEYGDYMYVQIVHDSRDR